MVTLVHQQGNGFNERPNRGGDGNSTASSHDSLSGGVQNSNTKAWLEKYSRRYKQYDRRTPHSWRPMSYKRHPTAPKTLQELPVQTRFGDQVVSKVLALARWRCRARKHAASRGYSFDTLRPRFAAFKECTLRSGCVFSAAFEYGGIDPHVDMLLQGSHAELDKRLALAAAQELQNLTPMAVINARVKAAMRGVQQWHRDGGLVQHYLSQSDLDSTDSPFESDEDESAPAQQEEGEDVPSQEDGINKVEAEELQGEDEDKDLPGPCSPKHVQLFPRPVGTPSHSLTSAAAEGAQRQGVRQARGRAPVKSAAKGSASDPPDAVVPAAAAEVLDTQSVREAVRPVHDVAEGELPAPGQPSVRVSGGGHAGAPPRRPPGGPPAGSPAGVVGAPRSSSRGGEARGLFEAAAAGNLSGGDGGLDSVAAASAPLISFVKPSAGPSTAGGAAYPGVGAAGGAGGGGVQGPYLASSGLPGAMTRATPAARKRPPRTVAPGGPRPGPRGLQGPSGRDAVLPPVLAEGAAVGMATEGQAARPRTETHKEQYKEPHKEQYKESDERRAGAVDVQAPTLGGIGALATPEGSSLPRQVARSPSHPAHLAQPPQDPSWSLPLHTALQDTPPALPAHPDTSNPASTLTLPLSQAASPLPKHLGSSPAGTTGSPTMSRHESRARRLPTYVKSLSSDAQIGATTPAAAPNQPLSSEVKVAMKTVTAVALADIGPGGAGPVEAMVPAPAAAANTAPAPNPIKAITAGIGVIQGPPAPTTVASGVPAKGQGKAAAAAAPRSLHRSGPRQGAGPTAPVQPVAAAPAFGNMSLAAPTGRPPAVESALSSAACAAAGGLHASVSEPGGLARQDAGPMLESSSPTRPPRALGVGGVAVTRSLCDRAELCGLGGEGDSRAPGASLAMVDASVFFSAGSGAGAAGSFPKHVSLRRGAERPRGFGGIGGTLQSTAAPPWLPDTGSVLPVVNAVAMGGGLAGSREFRGGLSGVSGRSVQFRASAVRGMGGEGAPATAVGEPSLSSLDSPTRRLGAHNGGGGSSLRLTAPAAVKTASACGGEEGARVLPQLQVAPPYTAPPQPLKGLSHSASTQSLPSMPTSPTEPKPYGSSPAAALGTLGSSPTGMARYGAPVLLSLPSLKAMASSSALDAPPPPTQSVQRMRPPIPQQPALLPPQQQQQPAVALMSAPATIMAAPVSSSRSASSTVGRPTRAEAESEPPSGARPPVLAAAPPRRIGGTRGSVSLKSIHLTTPSLAPALHSSGAALTSAARQATGILTAPAGGATAAPPLAAAEDQGGQEWGIAWATPPAGGVQQQGSLSRMVSDSAAVLPDPASLARPDANRTRTELFEPGAGGGASFGAGGGVAGPVIKAANVHGPAPAFLPGLRPLGAGFQDRYSQQHPYQQPYQQQQPQQLLIPPQQQSFTAAPAIARGPVGKRFATDGGCSYVAAAGESSNGRSGALATRAQVLGTGEESSSGTPYPARRPGVLISFPSTAVPAIPTGGVLQGSMGPAPLHPQHKARLRAR